MRRRHEHPNMGERDLSVILSSYNQPNALRLVLASFAAQDDLDFELIVADDGSDLDIRSMVAAFAQTAPFGVAFITQPHDGYRRARIANRAAGEARGSQLLFCDGDCVPFRNLVSVHKAAFREGCFWTAGCLYLTLEQSRSLTPETVANGTHELFLTLRPRSRLYWTHVRNVAYRLMGKKSKPKMKGANFSVDRRCLLDVDGFDEAYNGMSSEDSDLRNRLRNSGCDGVSLWHRAVVCHLDHRLDPRRAPQGSRRRRDPELYYSSYDRVKALKGMSHLSEDE